MAAEDLTGWPVLKLHNKLNFCRNTPAAIPVNAGPPRNIGQSVALPGTPRRQSRTTNELRPHRRTGWALPLLGEITCLAESARPRAQQLTSRSDARIIPDIPCFRPWL